MVSDQKYMREALELAALGKGKTSPNPLVGAIVVRDGEVVGRGYHERVGEAHAEAKALSNAGARARGATLYVNLEPCAHEGRTPPCARAIVEAGIARVVAPFEDPNPLVSGRGFALLREAGVAVETGVLEQEAARLNECYLKFVRTGLPFVTVKLATTLDGLMAAPDGDSQWITGEEERTFVHQLRVEHDAVMVGIGTVLADNPTLTARLVPAPRQPTRFVVDSTLRTDPGSNVLGPEARTIIACARPASQERVFALTQAGAEVWDLGDDGRGGVDLSELFRRIGGAEMTSVLVEGGRRLAAAVVREGLADKVIFCIAPKLLGKGLSAFDDLGVKGLQEAIKVDRMQVSMVGQDIIVEGYVSGT
ncbi:hypothetical protein AMJ39_04410 [candidate division TA06 bacterium DG_24]|uniref:Riboflavin biosynthesis protein RibD n=2 Tax=Bacteria division TA06 TaxID=1156500 RepID=A0A0S7WUD8_UNCT6|nr:MAG: hypothetical protein AMJ39_04410 [candidate division TA06 bacterium DG_24]